MCVCTHTCAISNGVSRPYDGKWSKTMVGYGAEDDHFAVELTYNYGIKAYEKGNDFQVPLWTLCAFDLLS